MPAPTPDTPVLIGAEASGVVTLTLNRGAARNTLSAAMLEALGAALDEIAAMDEARVVLLRAEGPGFCAGHDLREIRSHRDDSDGGAAFNAALFGACARVMGRIRALPRPVIAVVQGAAVAAGCELVASCDLAVASRAARFGVNGIDVGLFCSTPAVALVRNVTPKRAFELLATGRLIDAGEALEIGLVNRVVEPAELDGQARALAAVIADKPPDAVALGKATFYRQVALPLDEAYRIAGGAMVDNLGLEAAREGIAAFTEKRKPRWSRH
jgi:enoyl-CoA hydratase/carnithine racemase